MREGVTVLDIKKVVDEHFDYVVERRRHIHENPELSGKEFETVKYILAELKAAGMDPIEVPDGGVICLIHGKNPGKTLLLRADCDALPVDEPENNLKMKRTCRSKNPGVMHACGHDAHTSMLLTAGKILNEHRDEFNGTVLLCFERGEEGGGNIRYLMKYFDEHNLWYDAAFGMHVEQKMPTGEIALLDGPVNAFVRPINVTIHGRGGHGSRPDLANNPIECMVAILNSVYNIRMKYVSPFENITVSPCVVHAGTAGNVIPDVAEIKGTARVYTETAARAFDEALQRICKCCGEMYGCEVDCFKMDHLGLPVYNNPELAAFARDAVAKHLGAQAIGTTDPAMGSESFATYGQFAPAVFGNLGVATPEKGSGAEIHNRWFDIDEECLKIGVGSHLSFALEYLNSDINPAFERKTTVKEMFPDLYK